MHWLSLTLLSALSLAAADAATKAWLSRCDTRDIVLVRFTLTGLLLAPLLLVHPLPDLPLRFWAWIAALVPLEILAMVLYMQAIRDHPLALTLPYLAFSPVFVVLTGFLLLGESVSPKGFAGILLVVGGTWLLNLGHARPREWRSWGRPLLAVVRHRGSRLMLGVATLYSLTSVLGKGALQYMPPEQFGPFYFLLLGLASPLLLGVRRRGGSDTLWHRPWASLAVAACMGIMVVCHFLAISQIEAAYMIAVKRTSLLFGILFGALFFRETGLTTHLLAGGMMVAGVALIGL